MAYEKVVSAPTKDEALQKARDFMGTLDLVQSPITKTEPYQKGDQWCVLVRYYGFD